MASAVACCHRCFKAKAPAIFLWFWYGSMVSNWMWINSKSTWKWTIIPTHRFLVGFKANFAVLHTYGSSWFVFRIAENGVRARKRLEQGMFLYLYERFFFGILSKYSTLFQWIPFHSQIQLNAVLMAMDCSFDVFAASRCVLAGSCVSLCPLFPGYWAIVGDRCFSSLVLHFCFCGFCSRFFFSPVEIPL